MLVHQRLELLVDLKCFTFHTLQVLLPIDGVALEQILKPSIIDFKTVHVVFHLLRQESILAELSMDIYSNFLFKIAKHDMYLFHI